MGNKSISQPSKKSTHRTKSFSQRWLIVTVFCLIIVWIVGSIFPDKRTWGFHHGGYISVLGLTVLIIANLLILIPGIMPSIVAFIERIHRFANQRSRSARRLAFIAMLVSAGAFFYSYSLPVSLLGDSYLYIAEIIRSVENRHIDFFKYNSILNSFVFLYLGSHVVRLFHISDVAEIFKIFTSFFGIAFIVVFVRGIKPITKEIWDGVFLSGLFLGLGGVVFFFGYIEYYAPLFVCTTAYGLSLYGAVVKKKNLVFPSFFLCLCIALHFLAIFYLPALLIASIQRVHNSRGREFSSSNFLRISIIGMILFCFVYASVILMHIQPLYNSLIPMQKQSWTGTYTLFSSYHVFDIVNEILLAGIVPVFVLISLVIAFRNRITIAHQVTQVFSVFVLSLLIFTTIHFPFYGMARDWDIYAPVGISIALFAYVLYDSIGFTTGEKKNISVVVFVSSLISCVLWLSINLHETASVKRYSDILQLDEQHVHPDFAQYGYLNLSKYYGEKGDHVHQANTTRKMIELRSYPWDFARFFSVVNDLPNSNLVKDDVEAVVGLLMSKSTDSLFAGIKQDESKNDTSEYVIDQIFKLKPELQRVIFTHERIDALLKKNPSFSFCRSLIHRKNDLDESIRRSDYIRVFKHDHATRFRNKPAMSTYAKALISYNIGESFLREGNNDSARVWFEMSNRIDSTRSPLLNNYAIVLSRLGEYEAALSLFHKAIAHDSTYAMAYFNLARYYHSIAQDRLKASFYLQRYLSFETDERARSNAMQEMD